MNPLEEHPHLFANGKFQAYFDEEAWEIEGVYCGELMLHRNDPIYASGLTNYYSEQQDPQDCTLIARRIEDMTDEETAKFGRYGYTDHADVYENIRELISEHASGDIFCPHELLMLLNSGVYPFDQEHFKTGKVIDSRTLKQEESCQGSTE